jgi:YfiH family protein
MRFADCVPLFFVDPVKQAVGIAHAGWQGTIKKVASKTVEAFKNNFGSNPEDIMVGIGPSIGPDHYTIRDDVIQQVKEGFPDRWTEILLNHQGEVHFDLWKANQINLEMTGVTQIEISRICTGCNNQEWFSHRAENGKTGRFGAVIGLG